MKFLVIAALIMGAVLAQGIQLGGQIPSRVATNSRYIDLYPPSDAVNKIGWQAPASRATPIRLMLPGVDPSAGQALACGAPASNVSTCSWVTPLSAGDPATPGYIDLYPPSDATNKIGWQAPSSRSTPVRLVLPSADPAGSQTLVCASPSSGVSTCSWSTPASGGGSGTSNKYAAAISGTSTSVSAATHGLGSTVVVNGCKDGSGAPITPDWSVDGAGNVTISTQVSQAGTCYVWGQSIYAAAISGTSTSVSAATHGLGTGVLVAGCKDGSNNAITPDWSVDGAGNVTITTQVSQSGTCYLR